MIQEEEDTQAIKIGGATPAEQFLEPPHPELRLADADNPAGPALPKLFRHSPSITRSEIAMPMGLTR
jgi:hypothetical protein